MKSTPKPAKAPARTQKAMNALGSMMNTRVRHSKQMKKGSTGVTKK